MKVITNDDTNCTKALIALQKVIDPELGLNVVDLGLIYKIDFIKPEDTIHVVMTLTATYCPMGESIVTAVKRALENDFNTTKVQVDLEFDPPWSPEMISMEGKSFLNPE